MNKKEILATFKEKSADFINGKLSPLAFDKWFEGVVDGLIAQLDPGTAGEPTPPKKHV